MNFTMSSDHGPSAIYDGHMHIGGSAEPNPEELIRRLTACGISGGNVISIDPDDVNFTYEQRVENLFAWVKGYEDRLFPVAWLHPGEPDVLEKVRDLAARGVAAFKFIPNTYFPGDEQPMRVFRLIEELNLPVIFHSGVLYDFLESSQYNKPLNWECFAKFKRLRFSMGHCGHPWYDECVLMYGKFRWMRWHAACAANGEATINANNPWVLEHLSEAADGTRTFTTPQLFLDTTPGAHKAYRRDLLTKLVSCFPDGDGIFFGTDMYVEDYSEDVVKGWLAFENEILDEAGATQSFREKMYCGNLFSFLNLDKNASPRRDF